MSYAGTEREEVLVRRELRQFRDVILNANSSEHIRPARVMRFGPRTGEMRGTSKIVIVKPEGKGSLRYLDIDGNIIQQPLDLNGLKPTGFGFNGQSFAALFVDRWR
jgi:hypothetical protein